MVKKNKMNFYYIFHISIRVNPHINETAYNPNECIT